ncbi:hypothetical protein PoB_006908100 [Plakobranchus ocellatus]|uniref:Uncharacterized protein n=1 Tax=Plakobranchus ocellatus TaxID=259542 RepID=A0AAV4DEL5_9GAST|nr:hypothetical protein PoB_006908100 [Plakobranchus ocellatus]
MKSAIKEVPISLMCYHNTSADWLNYTLFQLEKKATTSTSSVTPPALTNIRRRRPQPVPVELGLLLKPLQTSGEEGYNQYQQCYSSSPYKHQEKKAKTSTSSVTPSALTNIRRRRPQPVPAVLLFQPLQTSRE